MENKTYSEGKFKQYIDNTLGLNNPENPIMSLKQIIENPHSNSKITKTPLRSRIFHAFKRFSKEYPYEREEYITNKALRRSLNNLKYALHTFSSFYETHAKYLSKISHRRNVRH